MHTVIQNNKEFVKVLNGLVYCWYAIYTRPCHEKKINEQLLKEGIEAYLPLQTTVRQWSDRKKKVQMPLFPCYVFVYASTKEYFKALNIPGVIRYVTFEGKAVPIPEKQISFIKSVLKQQDIEVLVINEKIDIGQPVEIIAGPLIGLNGELIDYANNKRVILRLDEINKTLLVNVPLSYIKNRLEVN